MKHTLSVNHLYPLVNGFLPDFLRKYQYFNGKYGNLREKTLY